MPFTDIELIENFHFGYCEADTKDGKVCNTELSPTGRCRNHMNHWNPAPAQASDTAWGKYRRSQKAKILEAVCGKCGETFNPNDEDDTIHGETQDGAECGGQGTITGHWEN